jgi:TatD DNase family protein
MSPAFDQDRGEVLERAFAAGVSAFVITGSDIESSTRAAAFAKACFSSGPVRCFSTRCFSTAGVHPHHAKTWDDASHERLQELIKENSPMPIVAVGECGLDYNRNFSPPDDQKKCFRAQLEFAARAGKPVFLHEREAFNDFYEILKQYRGQLPGAVVHCFTGGPELEAYLALDCYIGITGWVCDERRGGHLAPLLKQIPANRLLLETDAPYLLPRNLPRPARGKSGRNEPCYLPHIAAFVAEILGKRPELIAAETSANAARLFSFV